MAVILGLMARVLAEASVIVNLMRKPSLIEEHHWSNWTPDLKISAEGITLYPGPYPPSQHLTTTVVLPIECKPCTRLMVCCTMPAMSTTTSARTTQEERRRDRKPRPRRPLTSLLTESIWPLPLWAKWAQPAPSQSAQWMPCPFCHDPRTSKDYRCFMKLCLLFLSLHLC